MLQKNLTLAILFSDLSSSANLYESLGNMGALKLVNSCISVLSGIVADHHGTIINTIGDEVMCSFPSAEQAIKAAVVMQKSQMITSPFFRAGVWALCYCVSMKKATHMLWSQILEKK
ncbi:MAG: adenylate/guanylate cyclase domain-containing protein [Thermodesulfobacteriota bacterium]|nr:adenylate/guanylate cyclase domain-containing protein [Thermodesulfobacteriota bacterium]